MKGRIPRRIRYAWHQRGSILVREADSTPIVEIKHLEQLQTYDET
jgi:hypothetical protein